MPQPAGFSATLLSASMSLLLGAAACGGDPDDGAAADDGSGEGSPTLDTTDDAAASAAREGHIEGVLTDLKGVLSGFIEDDPTLDTAASAAANADAIAARIEEQSAGCAQVSVDHAEGTATLTVDFGEACVLAESGTTVSGSISATVAVAGGTVTVSFTFASLAVDTYLMDGSAAVSTSDLRSYRLVADLDVDGTGAVTFDGVAAVVASGDTVAATLDGDGTWVGEGSGGAPAPGGNGWTCTADGPTTYVMADLHRALDACWADAGSITLTKAYTCTKAGRRGQTQESTATVTTAMAWSAATATSGEITVTVTGTLAGQTIPTVTETMSLPSRAECP